MKKLSSKSINVINMTASLAAIIFALITAFTGSLSLIPELKEIHPACSKISLITALIAAIAGTASFITSTIQSRLKDRQITAALDQGINAEKLATQAELNLLKISKQNLALSEQLYLEKQKLLDIEKRLSKRKISTQQISILKNSISVSALKPIALLQITQQQSEIVEYGAQIASALKNAGVEVEISNTRIMTTGNDTGVRVLVMQGPGHQELEQAIRAANFHTEITNITPDPSRPTLHDPYRYAVIILVFPKLSHI